MSDGKVCRPIDAGDIAAFNRGAIAPRVIPKASLPFQGFEIKEKTAPVQDPQVLANYNAARILQERFAPKKGKGKPSDSTEGMATLYWKEAGSIHWTDMPVGLAFERARELRSKGIPSQVKSLEKVYDYRCLAIPLAEVWGLASNESKELDESKAIVLTARYDDGFCIRVLLKREADTDKGRERQLLTLESKCRSLCLDGARAVFMGETCVYTRDQALQSLPAPSIDEPKKKGPAMHINRSNGKWIPKCENTRVHFSHG